MESRDRAAILRFQTWNTVSLPPNTNRAGISDVPHFLQHLLPIGFLDQIQDEFGVRRNNSVYSPLVVICLLMLQRLHGGASLETAVCDLLPTLPASYWPHPCKRIRDWRQRGKAVSSHTGAYNQARQSLPESIVHRSFDHIFEQLMGRLSVSKDAGRRVFLLDGTTMRTAHSAELCRKYPPGNNQHGEAHWPSLRMVVAHDLDTGLAIRPEWGPHYGPQAVSEQSLIKVTLGRLPEGAIVMGDANFGVFSVAYAAQQSGHPVLLRLP